MSEIVNLYQAKTRLSSLVERAMAGEDIIIAKAGKPKVRLVAQALEENLVLAAVDRTLAAYNVPLLGAF